MLLQYRTCFHCLRMLHLFCNAFVHVIYSGIRLTFPYNTKLARHKCAFVFCVDINVCLEYKVQHYDKNIYFHR